MAYEKQNWQNDVTPLNDAHLNHMEDGIERANNTIVITTANEDLNDYTENGVYYFPYNKTPINIPTGVINGWLIVIKGGDNNTIKQIWLRLGTYNRNDFETYVRTKINVSGVVDWSSWQRLMVENDLYYKSGDSATIYWKSGGFLTTAATEIQFSIPLPKRIPSGVTPTITSGNIYVRLPSGGYLLNNVDITLDNNITLKSYGNILDVILTHSTAYQSTNNIPIAIQVSSLKIDFT